MAANLDPSDVMGRPDGYERIPLDEAELNALERGVADRARRAGFAVECIRGVGPAGTSTRVLGVLVDARSGLVRFSITRINGKADVWLQYKSWPPRQAKLAEVRHELDEMIGMRK